MSKDKKTLLKPFNKKLRKIKKYAAIFAEAIMKATNNIFNFWWWLNEHLFVT